MDINREKILKYLSSDEYSKTLPNVQDEVFCCECGEKLMAGDAALSYTTCPMSFLVIPPDMRKYWCVACSGKCTH